MNKTVLIIGNAETYRSYLLSGYDEIIVFKEVRYEHLLSYATQVWNKDSEGLAIKDFEAKGYNIVLAGFEAKQINTFHAKFKVI